MECPNCNKELFKLFTLATTIEDLRVRQFGDEIMKSKTQRNKRNGMVDKGKDLTV